MILLVTDITEYAKCNTQAFKHVGMSADQLRGIRMDYILEPNCHRVLRPWVTDHGGQGRAKGKARARKGGRHR